MNGIEPLIAIQEEGSEHLLREEEREWTFIKHYKRLVDLVQLAEKVRRRANDSSFLKID